MGTRRLASMLRWMPSDSAFHRAVDPEGIGSGWTRTNHLLATLAEVSDLTNIMMLRAHFKEVPGPQPEPLRISRPGRLIEKTEPLTGAALESALTQLGGAVVKGKSKKRKG